MTLLGKIVEVDNPDSCTHHCIGKVIHERIDGICVVNIYASQIAKPLGFDRVVPWKIPARCLKVVDYPCTCDEDELTWGHTDCKKHGDGKGNIVLGLPQ